MADLASELSEAQKSLSELESRYASLVTKHENTENDLAFHKARYDSAVSKITAEKDAEIEQLKATFAEISEKRKEAFSQLKEKLQQASVVVNRYAQAQAENETALQRAQEALSQADSRATTAESQLNQLRSSQGDTSSRVSTLEAELAAVNTSLTASQTELESLRGQLAAADDKARGKPSAKCSISVEDGGAEPLIPGVVENGRSLLFKWSLAGSVRIQWYRSFRGGQFEPIPGKAATKPGYSVNIDDVGACLRAEATHTTTGASVFAECGPVHPSGAMIQALTDPLKKLDATFTVESSNATEGDKQRRLLLNKEKIKLQDGKGKTVAKKEWSDNIKALLDGDSDRRFSVQIESSGPVVNYTAPNQRMRDLIVCSVRLFTHVIVKHNGKLNKDNDHLLALSLYIRTLNETVHLRPASTVPASRRQPSVSATGQSTPSGSKGGKPPVAPGSAGKAPAATPPRQGSIGGNQSSIGPNQGSAPSTPQSRSIDGSQHLPSNTRKPSSVDHDDEAGWGLPPAALSAPSNGGGAAAGAQVDADGFIVTKNRGFDDYAPKNAEDSDPEDAVGEGAEAPVQAIKVQINAEARAPASADSLKSSLSGISLGGPKAKKGKKGDKKEKVAGAKKGKKEGEDASIPSSNDSNATSNSVPGLPPLAPSTAGDNSDPFAEFFKSTSPAASNGPIDPLAGL